MKSLLLTVFIVVTMLLILTVPAVGQPVQQDRTNRVVQERSTTGGQTQDRTTVTTTDRDTQTTRTTQQRDPVRDTSSDSTDIVRTGEVESEKALAGWGTAWWQATLEGGERSTGQAVRTRTRDRRDDDAFVEVAVGDDRRRGRGDSRRTRDRTTRTTDDGTAPSGDPLATVQQTGSVRGDNTTLVQNVFVTVQRFMGGMLGSQSQFQQRSQGASSSGGVDSRQLTSVTENQQLNQNGEPVRGLTQGQQQSQMQAVGRNSRAMNQQLSQHNSTLGNTQGQAAVSQRSQAAGPGPAQIGSQQAFQADLSQNRMPVMSVQQGSDAAAPGGAAQVSEQFSIRGQGPAGAYDLAEMNNGSTFGGNASASLSQGAQAGIPPR